MADTSTPTRARILDEAMRLFADRGFRGTSVAAIEEAAGLSPGSGALYHHFTTKDAVLAEGVARQLARLDALRDIRRIFAGAGDVAAQLAVAARYYLAELDSQPALLRLVVTEGTRRPDLLGDATRQLLDRTYDGFADWLVELSGGRLGRDRAMAVSVFGIGALVSSRLTGGVGAVGDELLVDTWTEMLLGLVVGVTAG